MSKKDLLIEIGTEELPPKALKGLATAFAGEIHQGLDRQELAHDTCHWYASPRRLAVLVKDLVEGQADREIERRGPALAAAFDEDGRATKAAEGFARSCGVAVEALQRLETEKGTWLAYRARERGKASAELLEEIINTALGRLPIPKRMRWGDGDAEFVRPVHWVAVVFGEQAVPCRVMGLEAGRLSFGHRFHSPGSLEIRSAGDYLELLHTQGKVLADYAVRRQRIRELVESCAHDLNGRAVIDEDLLDEVCALVEWPEVISGEFSTDFLQLPDEVLVASMQDHQKYFPVRDADGKLLPCFITVANIQSSDPGEIRRGNERVILPRLSDAAFFWKRDNAKALADYQPGLKNIIYQKQLGSLHDKSTRVATIAVQLAERLGVDGKAVQRAAMLAKCDLLTSMVGEFPELQGVMGRYYAGLSGEENEVALAIDEHYRPRHAGDALPSSLTGQLLSLAEKIDTLLGIFAIGQAPTGDRDPFGLRRAAIGLLRTLIECELDIDLAECLHNAAGEYEPKLRAEDSVKEVMDFILQRLKGYYLDDGIPNGVFESVLALAPANLLDFHRRVIAVNKFSSLPEAHSLAAANKRIKNILRQNHGELLETLSEDLLKEEAERQLVSTLSEVSKATMPLLEDKDYENVLARLAGLREAVDRFFDEVMVMSEDVKLKQNRLAILGKLNRLFMSIADISELQIQEQ